MAYLKFYQLMRYNLYDFDYELSKYVSTKIDYEIDTTNKEYLYEILK